MLRYTQKNTLRVTPTRFEIYIDERNIPQQAADEWSSHLAAAVPDPYLVMLPDSDQEEQKTITECSQDSTVSVPQSDIMEEAYALMESPNPIMGYTLPVFGRDAQVRIAMATSASRPQRIDEEFLWNAPLFPAGIKPENVEGLLDVIDFFMCKEGVFHDEVDEQSRTYNYSFKHMVNLSLIHTINPYVLYYLPAVMHHIYSPPTRFHMREVLLDDIKYWTHYQLLTVLRQLPDDVSEGQRSTETMIPPFILPVSDPLYGSIANALTAYEQYRRILEIHGTMLPYIDLLGDPQRFALLYFVYAQGMSVGHRFSSIIERTKEHQISLGSTEASWAKDATWRMLKEREDWALDRQPVEERITVDWRPHPRIYAPE